MHMSDRVSDHQRLRYSYLIFAVANLLPVAGILYFDWTSVELGTLYWIESGFVLASSLIKSLFAKKIFEFDFRGQITIRFEGYTKKRGGIRPTDGFPPIYPRNLPNIFPYLMLGLGWIMGGLLIVVESPFSLLENTLSLSIATSGILLVFTSVVFCRYLVVFLDVFLAEERHDELSAGLLNMQAIEYVAIIGVLVFLSRADVANTVSLAWGIFVLKVGYELIRYRPDHLHWGDNVVLKALGVSPTYSDPNRAFDPRGVLLEKIQTDQRPTVISALLFAAVSDLLVPYWILMFFAVILALGGAANVVIPSIVVVTVFVSVTFYPLKVGEYLLSYRWMSYRIYDGKLVGYDQLLKQPQWKIDLNEICSTSIEERYADSRYGTQTIIIETDEESVILPHLVPQSQFQNRIQDLV